MTDFEYKGKKLSIIIPVYNAEKYIRECLESIFRQGLIDSDFEVILVDDGSIDKSFCVIKDIIDCHENIVIIKQDNNGPSVARNFGIKNASGFYILFVDADDLLIDCVLPDLLNIAFDNSVDILVGDYLRLNNEMIEKGNYEVKSKVSFVKKTGHDLYLDDLDPHHSYIWRTLYRKQFLIDNKLSSIMEGFCFEDIPFVHECYLKASKCIKTNQIVCVYRIGHNSITSFMNKDKILELNKSIEQLWKLQYELDLSSRMLISLKDKIFSVLSYELWCVSHNSTIMNDYEEILNDLKCRIPNLSFYNGLKQRFVTYMLWKHPYVFLKFRSLFS